jgi:hypothetical protein
MYDALEFDCFAIDPRVAVVEFDAVHSSLRKDDSLVEVHPDLLELNRIEWNCNLIDEVSGMPNSHSYVKILETQS